MGGAGHERGAAARHVGSVPPGRGPACGGARARRHRRRGQPVPPRLRAVARQPGRWQLGADRIAAARRDRARDPSGAGLRRSRGPDTWARPDRARLRPRLARAQRRRRRTRRPRPSPDGTRTPRGLAAAGARRCPSQRPLPAGGDARPGSDRQGTGRRPRGSSGGRGRRRGRAGGARRRHRRPRARSGGRVEGSRDRRSPVRRRRPRADGADRLGRPGDLKHERAQMVAGQQADASHPRSPRRATGPVGGAPPASPRPAARRRTSPQPRRSCSATTRSAGSTSTNCPRAGSTHTGRRSSSAAGRGDRGTERLLVSHARDRRGRPDPAHAERGRRGGGVRPGQVRSLAAVCDRRHPPNRIAARARVPDRPHRHRGARQLRPDPDRSTR